MLLGLSGVGSLTPADGAAETSFLEQEMAMEPTSRTGMDTTRARAERTFAPWPFSGFGSYVVPTRGLSCFLGIPWTAPSPRKRNAGKVS
jgi:hypothetical protein